MNLPMLRQFLQALPFWFVLTVWILLVAAATAATLYLFWYIADRNDRGRTAVRGFSLDQDRPT